MRNLEKLLDSSHQEAHTNTQHTEEGPMRVERLQNGFVRVNTKSGLVHLWEMVPGLAGPMVQRRSGNGISEPGEVEAVWSAFDVR